MPELVREVFVKLEGDEEFAGLTVRGYVSLAGLVVDSCDRWREFWKQRSDI